MCDKTPQKISLHCLDLFNKMVNLMVNNESLNKFINGVDSPEIKYDLKSLYDLRDQFNEIKKELEPFIKIPNTVKEFCKTEWWKEFIKHNYTKNMTNRDYINTLSNGWKKYSSTFNLNNNANQKVSESIQSLLDWHISNKSINDSIFESYKDLEELEYKRDIKDFLNGLKVYNEEEYHTCFVK